MRYGMALFVLGSSVVFWSRASAYTNEPIGFRGLTWGTEESTIKGLRLVEDDGAMKFYTRSTDALHVGAAELKDIVYGFYKGRLSDVLMHTAGNGGSDLKAAFAAQFGTARKDEYRDFYAWEGDRTTVELDCNSISFECTGIFQSSVLQSQREADKKAAAAKAGKDL